MGNAKNTGRTRVSLGYARRTMEGLEEAVREEPIAVLFHYGEVEKQVAAVNRAFVEAVPQGKVRKHAKERSREILQKYNARLKEYFDYLTTPSFAEQCLAREGHPETAARCHQDRDGNWRYRHQVHCLPGNASRQARRLKLQTGKTL